MSRSRIVSISAVVCLWAAGCRPPESLLNLIEEPPGANCVNGGTAIQTGLDENEDGELQEGEVTDTAFVCNGEDAGLLPAVVEGSLLLETADQIALAQNVETVTGQLLIASQGIADISLPNLQTVNGQFFISGVTQGQTFSFPLLASIGEDLSFNGDFVDIEFPSLVTSQSVNAPDAGEIRLPELTSTGDITFSGAAILAPKLATAGDIRAGDADLDFPLLTSALDLLASNTEITSINLPLLQSLQNLDLQFCDSLSSFSLPSLASVSDEFRIAQNDGLQTVSFPNLTSVTNRFEIRQNPLLPTCQAQALAAQLTQAPTNGVNISGNNDQGVCP